MAKIVICLILTLVFSGLGWNSFMSKDYRPLQEWLAYYQEYKELQGAVDKGNAQKAALLTKLKKMYPEKAQQWERSSKIKFSEWENDVESATSPEEPKQQEPERQPQETPKKQQAPAVSQNKKQATPANTNNGASINRNNNKSQ